MAAVNNSRRRSSGMREAPENPSSIQPILTLDQFRDAPAGDYLVARTFGKRMRAHRKFHLNIAAPQNFDSLSRSDQSAVIHQRRIDFRAVRKYGETLQVNLSKLLAPRCVFLQ